MERPLTLAQIIHEKCNENKFTMILGYLRYETLRKMNPQQFAELHKRNLNGENFDMMVDAIIIKNENIR